MNQSEFDNMSVERLEILISCQRESTELEIMLVKKLLEIEGDVAIAKESEKASYDDLCNAGVEIDHYRITVEEVLSLATDPEDKSEALDEIIKLCQ